MVTELSNLNQKLPEAAAKLAGMPRVTPEVMMIVYLDEIAGRLAEIQDKLDDLNQEGELNSFSLSITSRPTTIPLFCRYLSLRNDGPDSIYVFQSKMRPLSIDSQIKLNGELKLDFGTVKRRVFYIICSSGATATVRMFVW